MSISLPIKNWTMQYAALPELSCTAPCSMYSVLLEHGKIPDPFDGIREQKLGKLSEIGCVFEAEFTADRALLSKERIDLVFEGLDTICTIFLNGFQLDKVQNMHRSYRYEVKNNLNPGVNRIRLEFSSPTQYFSRMHERHELYSNDGCTISGAAHLRKAFFMSGWDWAPTLPDMGIWRPVRLIGYDSDRILDVQVRQNHHDGVVDLTVSVETAFRSGLPMYVRVDGQTKRILNGTAMVRIAHPKLWWVRGYGDQPLYEVEVWMEDSTGYTTISRQVQKIGLRTLTVSTKPDAEGSGRAFCFVINGVKIFAMGANYVPQDSLLTRVDHERLDEMMQQCLDGHFNALRVWGGGVYPDDYFYELCDENGILVWQDFMLACVNVWLTPEMEREYRAEAEENLKRIRNHPCLGLICGNNEMESAVLHWGIANNQLIREDYIALYERILPEIAARLAPETFYWPSSPCSGGGLDDPNNPAKGDVHDWEVWHGGVPFTAYRKKHYRFCSEFGFEAFPSMKTIRSFAKEDDLNCFSRVMEGHQKCIGGNQKILRYLADHYLYPHSFEKLVYASQLLQADAIKYGVQHFRRERGYCMGTLYWQFNDCWPVASWSSVDYFGRYKALHYAARKFYAPVALGLFLEGNQLTVNLSNETREQFTGAVRLSVRSNTLEKLDSREETVQVAALSSADVLRYRVPEVDPDSSVIAVDLYDDDGTFLMRETQLLVPPKYFAWKKPSFTVECRPVEGGVEIRIGSDVYAQGVCIDFTDMDCVLSDNFFPLTDHQLHRVIAWTDHSTREVQSQMTIQSVYDIR